ncbi:hypothetical protein HGT73_09315 [Rosenbergiella australiborealis]|uniref:Flagellar protein FliT n=1 Tax=Rosenbergiella australiborealis TaxID=1544696 RepID=A0ABS5T5F2_9GAMM|nr:hypothetical protein [Rosenbergiella australiborealis]MBT0727580.1 hypothetical protein [Rosenbergiella australiborealis]
MADPLSFTRLLSAVVEAIKHQDWDKLIIANQQLTSQLEGETLTEAQRQQLRQVYQAGLAECHIHADDLWQKIQNTVNEREAMAAYARFGDAESFLG